MFTLPKIIDNHRKSLLDVIKSAADKYDTISITSGYWDFLGAQMVLEEKQNE